MEFTRAGLLTLACCALATTSLMFAATTAFGQDQAKLETVGLRWIAFSDGDRALALSMFLPRVVLGRSSLLRP